jgi:orotate phosphoribosyltransferase
MTAADTAAILDRFRRAGALLEGHFRLTSGLHSSGYLQCALVLQYPREAEALGAAIADRVQHLGVQAVLSPALGGIVIGQEVGRTLGVRALFAERQDGRLMLRRGFSLQPGERVLVVEDVVTTGGSTRETIEVARAAGAVVVGAAAIIDRRESPNPQSQIPNPKTQSPTSDDLGFGTWDLGFGDIPFHALAEVSLPTYDPGSCPLCLAGRPVVKPGSRTV